MLVIMNAGDAERRLDLGTMPIKDAAECERLTGLTWTEWRSALAEDRAAAVAFAWYLAGKREGVETGRFSDIDLDLAKLRWSVELTDAEKAESEAAAADGDEDPDLPTSPVEAETPAT